MARFVKVARRNDSVHKLPIKSGMTSGGGGNERGGSAYSLWRESCLAQSDSQMTTNSIIPTQSLNATIAHSQIVRISGHVPPAPQMQSIPAGCLVMIRT